jgi:lysophospholipid acyltransferase (LPLAT)-like uncharacterized protein
MRKESLKSTGSNSAVVTSRPPAWHQKLAAWCIYAALKILYATLRPRWQDDSGVLRSGIEPIVFCTWHNRLALSMLTYHGYVRKVRPDQELAAMVSASKDGGLLSIVLDNFHVQAVRGSTSRRGRQALLECTTWIENGRHLAITPDGPRGPCYSIQEGIIALAQVTGVPIVPVSTYVRWKISLRSWDRFQIPLPFARCDIRLGPALRVPRDASEAERALLREQLRERMLSITTD